jgi:hypothetical protein
MKLIGICSLVLPLVNLGCAGSASDESLDLGGPESVEIATQGTSINGTSINGTSINGTSINGTSINGTSINGTSINGTSINGTSINGTSINGTSINGTSINGTVLTSPSLPGGDFTGSRWFAELSNGEPLELRIDGSAALPGPNAAVMTYQVSYANGVGWSPLCGADAAGNPIAAIAMTGTWSYEQGVAGGGGYTPDASKITFACRGKAIAKCLEMGYRPGVSGGSLTPAETEQLVACTRLLRADYCGDGRSFTVDGTLVNLYDGAGIQSDTQPWTIEAEWTSAGARCTNEALLTRLTVSGLTPPSCFASKVSASCGDLAHFATGTTLMNELAH